MTFFDFFFLWLVGRTIWKTVVTKDFKVGIVVEL